ncbi:hypothetical protein B7C42_08119 [Nocardia cerradoensis]|uniref:Uncharacterized protein n=1 Tax=Nocardia cerradoensis TaxID=85688 RepID=A0A231GT56_9NOCA|nr:hypothetical protein B7C42_08119 [Nocardia cerradoensis]
MGDDDPDDGGAYFTVVAAVLVMLLDFSRVIEVLDAWVGQGDHPFRSAATAVCSVVGQAEISAQHVDALLAAQPVGFIGDAGHRVHPRDPHRDIGRPELRGRGAEPLHEPALLNIPLTAVGDHQRHHPTDPADHGQRQLRDIHRGTAALWMKRGEQDPLRHHRD